VTHHFVIGGFMRLRFEKALAVLLLMASMAFMPNSLWAEDAVPVSSDGAEASPSEEPAVLLPDIYFSLSEDGRISIQAVGFNKSQVSSFTFDGQDVTEVIEGLKESGVLEGRDVLIKDEEGKVYPANGFEMKISVEPSVLEGHSFGVVLVNGLELQKTVDFSEDKGKYAQACFYGAAATLGATAAVHAQPLGWATGSAVAGAGCIVSIGLAWW